MLPTISTTIPSGDEWRYEVKYDGYRSILYIDKDNYHFISRNLKPLNNQFPELLTKLTEHKEALLAYSPMILDGEICILASDIKADFESIQTRGRLKSSEKISLATKNSPATFVCFDLLMQNGKLTLNKPYLERKSMLKNLLYALALPHFHYVKDHKSYDKLWSDVVATGGEGIVAKKVDSLWTEGKRTKDWYKVKNLNIATVFITAMERTNQYFQLGVNDQNKIKIIGKVGQGFSKEEKEALYTIIIQNQTSEDKQYIYIKPSICIEIEYLELYKEQIRHPKFRRFRLDKQWEECTWGAIRKVDQT